MIGLVPIEHRCFLEGLETMNHEIDVYFWRRYLKWIENVETILSSHESWLLTSVWTSLEFLLRSPFFNDQIRPGVGGAGRSKNARCLGCLVCISSPFLLTNAKKNCVTSRRQTGPNLIACDCTAVSFCECLQQFCRAGDITLKHWLIFTTAAWLNWNVLPELQCIESCFKKHVLALRLQELHDKFSINILYYVSKFFFDERCQNHSMSGWWLATMYGHQFIYQNVAAANLRYQAVASVSESGARGTVAALWANVLW